VTSVSGSWETNAPGPFVTIRAGGPLDGVVTITAIAGGNGRSLVEVTWRQDGEVRSESLEAATYNIARAIANAAANQFAVGRRPNLARD
jgi:metal-dependent amidase/aminoacylase/carboxypeptidase family protein